MTLPETNSVLTMYNEDFFSTLNQFFRDLPNTVFYTFDFNSETD